MAGWASGEDLLPGWCIHTMGGADSYSLSLSLSLSLVFLGFELRAVNLLAGTLSHHHPFCVFCTRALIPLRIPLSWPHCHTKAYPPHTMTWVIMLQHRNLEEHTPSDFRNMQIRMSHSEKQIKHQGHTHVKMKGWYFDILLPNSRGRG
jgi:hypothetical protein